eukprot:1150819-Pelagomonas_calceolata.AAC.2
MLDDPLAPAGGHAGCFIVVMQGSPTVDLLALLLGDPITFKAALLGMRQIVFANNWSSALEKLMPKSLLLLLYLFKGVKQMCAVCEKEAQ